MVSTPFSQWFCWSLSLFNGYFIGKINPTFSDKPICFKNILDLSHQIFSPMKNHEKFAGIRTKNDFTMQNEALVRKLWQVCQKLGLACQFVEVQPRIFGIHPMNHGHGVDKNWEYYEKFANLPSKNIAGEWWSTMIFLGITWWFPKCSCNQHAGLPASWWRNPTWWFQPPRIPGYPRCFFSWKIAMVKPPDHGKPMGNPWETHGKPMGNPWETHGKPMGNPKFPLPPQTWPQHLVLGRWWLACNKPSERWQVADLICWSFHEKFKRIKPLQFNNDSTRLDPGRRQRSGIRRSGIPQVFVLWKNVVKASWQRGMIWRLLIVQVQSVLVTCVSF